MAKESDELYEAMCAELEPIWKAQLDCTLEWKDAKILKDEIYSRYGVSEIEFDKMICQRIPNSTIKQ